jgi:hypothetical protein
VKIELSSSEEMARLAFGNPGFFDFLKDVGVKVLRGAVKSIPFVGGIASEFLDPAINAITSIAGGDQDNRLDTEGDDD